MRVLISGAGVAGPTLAWFLAKAGASITIIEKSHSLLPHGQNVDIKSSALAVIKKMGLMDQLERLNTTEKGTQFVDTIGRPIARFPVKEGVSVSLTSQYEILRGDLSAMLYEATKNQSGIDYLFGTTVEEVTSNDNDAVKVRLSNGELREIDLLVAADGQWSKVRRQCFPQGSVKAVDTGLYTAYWTVPRLADDNDWWNIYIGLDSRLISLRPDPHGSVRALFNRMPKTAAQKEEWQQASRSDRKMQQELLRRDFMDAGWQSSRFLNALAKAPDFCFQTVQQIQMTKWSTFRVVCLGDAAFCPTPLTGMGTTLAITGAYVLAGELSKIIITDDSKGNGNCNQPRHPGQALSAYERIFRPFVEEAQKIPPFVPGIVHPETAWRRWMLETFVWAISKFVAVASATPWLASKFNVDDFDNFTLPEYEQI